METGQDENQRVYLRTSGTMVFYKSSEKSQGGWTQDTVNSTVREDLGKTAENLRKLEFPQMNLELIPEATLESACKQKRGITWFVWEETDLLWATVGWNCGIAETDPEDRKWALAVHTEKRDFTDILKVCITEINDSWKKKKVGYLNVNLVV